MKLVLYILRSLNIYIQKPMEKKEIALVIGKTTYES